MWPIEQLYIGILSLLFDQPINYAGYRKSQTESFFSVPIFSARQGAGGSIFAQAPTILQLPQPVWLHQT